MAANHQVEAEAPVTVDGLVIDQAEKEAEEKKQLSEEEEEEELETNIEKETKKAEKVKKKKNNSQYKPMVLEEKVHNLNLDHRVDSFLCGPNFYVIVCAFK